MTIKDLQPSSIWNYFYDITQIPRPSKSEEKIAAYLLDFAKKQNLEAKQDKAGNVLITKPATPGKESIPTVVLQSHMDMVCEKNSDIEHDFHNDPIETIIDGDWVKTNGTTLGADNGIGVAAQLAILASDKLSHGKIEALFTVDEETGLTGAASLEKGFITADTLINLDMDSEGEIYIGCAGGKSTKACFNYKPTGIPKNYFWFKVMVKGARGGHSGSDIDKGLCNANKILVRYIDLLMEKNFEVRIADIEGGNLNNAIAREAFALLGVKERYKEAVRVEVNTFLADVQNEYRHTEPNLNIELETVVTPTKIIDEESAKRLVQALMSSPHGVIKMSRDIPGLVETSTNLASVKIIENNQIEVGTSQRSSLESQKKYVVNMVTSLFELAGAEVTHNEGYPGWQPNSDSKILKLAQHQYRELFKKDAEIKAVHAGLECGLFLEKEPHLDMISIGPDMKDCHSPDEKLKISSVKRFWDFLVTILENIPEE